MVVRETQCAKSPYGEGEQRQSPWQEATVSSPGHPPLSRQALHPALPALSFPGVRSYLALSVRAGTGYRH